MLEHDKLMPMRYTFVAFLFLLPAVAGAADKDFNGRWDITVNEQNRKRAWWLEVDGAGTPNMSGMFVGAPGGQLDKIPALAIENGELKFTFARRYREGRGDQVNNRTGTYRARLVNGKLDGTFELEGEQETVHWTGVRAPKLHGDDPHKWHDGTPVELFNGRDLQGWKALQDNKPSPWTVSDGILKNDPRASDLVTEQNFWNFKLHIEYRIGPKSNSGIGLRGRYEVQIFDDYGQPPSLHGNGALYSRILPVINASKPAGQWQSFDITLIENQVSVVLNDAKIVDRRQIDGLTAIAIDPNESAPGPIVIQGDHGVVEFRKITLTPLVKGKPKT
jgi:hypothetical protein